MLIVDSHEDIAWNILTFGMDYTRSALWNRQREDDLPRPIGNTLLGKPEWLLGHVGLIFATLFVASAHRKAGSWDRLCYSTPREAYTLAQKQIDTYKSLVERDEQFRLVTSQQELSEVVASWSPDKALKDRLIGFVLLMEGADPILEPDQVEEPGP